MYLGNVGSLGEEVMAAFAAVVGAAALKVARGVVLTRPTPGLEERVKSTHLLQELVKWVPADLFRTCLTRVRSLPQHFTARFAVPQQDQKWRMACSCESKGYPTE